MNPTHSEYCHCECPEGNSFEKLQETLNRVRIVHILGERDGEKFCTHCLDPLELDYFQSWPCATIKALENKE